MHFTYKTFFLKKLDTLTKVYLHSIEIQEYVYINYTIKPIFIQSWHYDVFYRYTFFVLRYSGFLSSTCTCDIVLIYCKFAILCK